MKGPSHASRTRRPAELADQPTATASRKLPPSECDFEIYEAVHVCNCSTRFQADKYDISQTRVRQIIRRVVAKNMAKPGPAKVPKRPQRPPSQPSLFILHPSAFILGLSPG